LNAPANIKSLAVDNLGRVWVTNMNGAIYSHAGRSEWIEQDQAGDADDISIGSDGNIPWILNMYGQPVKVTNIFEKIFMENAAQNSDADLTHLAPNPIKRVDTYGTAWNASPYTCTKTTSYVYPTRRSWTADFIQKDG
jgi:hypothetical protein